MKELIKVRDISLKYDISTRALKYYEDMGLITSTRSEDYAYRMYDEEAVKRLEQILILRKLNISIKDIQRIFTTAGSEVVLEVLGKKVENIDEEVALLHELKDIVLDFIREIERINFADNSDIKSLYDKAKEIESQLISVDYIGKPSNVNRLLEITEKLSSNKLPEVRIIQLPKCKMATSGAPDTTGSEVWNFSNWWGGYEKKYPNIIAYAPTDFLTVDGGFVWMSMVNDNATSEDCGGHEIIDFEGGLYAVCTSIDGDGESNDLVYKKIKKWLESTEFEFDEHPGDPSRQSMGHMINPTDEIKQGLGYHQFEVFVPIKLRSK
ncbi:MAG: MerR family transcriptional regulator [Oscillospiraceae bacterium]|nr:MerR family transcriptional regulator [Oscillospiraceae bacterium]